MIAYSVIDDFCQYPEKVSASVHAAGFGTWLPNKGEVGSSVYEGMGFWGDHAPMVKSLMHAVGGPVCPNTMYFRVTNVGMEEAYIHSDRETGNHTCVAYLSDHAEMSGTAFYKHKGTGLTHMPSMEQMREQGIIEELKADMVSRDPNKWEQLDFVRAKYNRALIFQAPMFHSRFPFEGIGDTAESGRLVWASHFYKLSPSGELF